MGNKQTWYSTLTKKGKKVNRKINSVENGTISKKNKNTNWVKIVQKSLTKFYI